MAKRYHFTRTLVELRENIRQFPTLADQHIHNTIVESLSQAQRDLWYWILENEQPVTAAMVCHEWKYNFNYASGLLNELWQFGLLQRAKTEVISTRRKQVSHGYVYRIKAAH